MRLSLLMLSAVLLVLSGCGGGGGGGDDLTYTPPTNIVPTPTPVVTPSAPLNDTGIDWFADAITNFLAAEPVSYPGQDASYGRDAAATAGTLVKTGGGVAGFDFTKLDDSGTALADQSVAYAATPWACVEDNVTGLIWEIKSDDGGLHDKDWTYTWYNSSATTNGGSAGTANGGSCIDTTNCDTEKFVAAVNAAGLCGASDWRMPTEEELLSIVDFGSTSPTIDTDCFPNAGGTDFWSAAPSAVNIALAWQVNFSSGVEDSAGKNVGKKVRLVRDAP